MYPGRGTCRGRWEREGPRIRKGLKSEDMPDTGSRRGWTEDKERDSEENRGHTPLYGYRIWSQLV